LVGTDAGREQERRNVSKITAYHTNGYVKFSGVRADEDVAAFVATLEARGYWTNITVEPFVLVARKRRAA
jgi:hypothetical protein